jgi:hypothetical protein
MPEIFNVGNANLTKAKATIPYKAYTRMGKDSALWLRNKNTPKNPSVTGTIRKKGRITPDVRENDSVEKISAG